MNELQRQAYLKAMDIQPFYLKQSLAAAKASPVYDLPRDSDAEDQPVRPVSPLGGGAEKAAVESSAKPVGLTELKLELKQLNEGAGKKPLQKKADTAANPVVEEADPDPVPAPKSVDESTGELTFKIRYYRITEQIAVIDECPYAREDDRKDDKLTLLKAILSALKIHWQDCDFHFESFSWPIDADMEFEEGSQEAALQMLNGFIAQRQTVDKFENLLVFAGQLETILASTEQSQGREYSTTVTSSLSAMLSYPLLKRQVWTQLQPLKRRLASARL